MESKESLSAEHQQLPGLPPTHSWWWLWDYEWLWSIYTQDRYQIRYRTTTTTTTTTYICHNNTSHINIYHSLVFNSHSASYDSDWNYPNCCRSYPLQYPPQSYRRWKLVLKEKKKKGYALTVITKAKKKNPTLSTKQKFDFPVEITLSDIIKFAANKIF